MTLSFEGGKIIFGADLKISMAPRFGEVSNYIKELDVDKVLLDASKAYWVSPFTACWLASLCDTILESGRTIEILPPSRDNARHQWNNLGIDEYLGKPLRLSKFRQHPAFAVTKLTEPSYPLASNVTKMLAEPLKGVGNFYKALLFTIREIIENCFEHGKTDHCYMCAYSIPSKNVVRLCILDGGIGIPASLRLNRKFSQNEDDLDLVEQALEYGVSSKTEDRGIGMYILRDVVENNSGKLSICSGKAFMEISDELVKRDLEISYPGTAIELMLKTKRDFYYIDAASWDEL